MIVFTTDTINLDELRQRIQGIDYSIMSLIKERIQLAKQVGKLKHQQKLPIRNYQVEKLVIERIKKFAMEFNFEPEIAKSIYHEIIKASVNAQLEQSVLVTSSDMSFRCVVIGGAGKMGRWMVDFLRSSGHACDISDPTTDDQIKELSYYDFIIIATPLNITPTILREIIAQKPPGIIFDVASLKSELTEDIIQAQHSGLKISSIHPMFGPDIISLEGRNILICETELSACNQDIRELFKETSVNLVGVNLEQHDLYISYTLGLSHMINLLMGRIVEQSGFTYDDLLEFAGSTFIKQMQTTGELYSENPYLYHTIQNQNSFSQTLYKFIQQEFEKLVEISVDSDPEKFVELMHEVHDYLRPHIGK